MPTNVRTTINVIPAVMVKVIVGLMGSTFAPGATAISGTAQLRSLLAMLDKYNVHDLDTARGYHGGRSEQDLGDVPAEEKRGFLIATKAPGFTPDSLGYQQVIDNCNASLTAMKQNTIDLYYFHGPDRKTPLQESCRAIHDLHQQAKIATFGISNFNAEEVEQIHSICTANGWILPTVYQGMYNGLTRAGEVTIFPTLRRLGIAFYAFSPLAGGYFSKTSNQLRQPAPGTRMDAMEHFSNMFVNDTSLELHDRLQVVCEEEGVTMKEATLRWLMHHSILCEQDGVILGGSSVDQLEENVRACKGGPLPLAITECFENIWKRWQDAGKSSPGSL